MTVADIDATGEMRGGDAAALEVVDGGGITGDEDRTDDVREASLRRKAFHS